MGELAEYMVLDAVHIYRLAKKKIRKYPTGNLHKWQAEIDEIREFFKSDWFRLLFDSDRGHEIINGLEQEACDANH